MKSQRGVSLRRVAGLALIAFVISSCASSAAVPAATVMVRMGDKDIALSQNELSAGLVAFTVMNAGTIVHSLVLIRTDVPHDQMKLDAADPSKVDEKGSIAVTGQMAVGAMARFERSLVAGKYVLVCNEPAHYAVGMHAGLVVK